MPGVNFFKPAGVPLKDLDEIVLTLEEAEAIRLKDIEKLEQEEGAVKMNISRPTFQRVLTSARQKIADAILNGKAIRIDGGNFEMAYRRFRCRGGHEWEIDNPTVNIPALCPTCNATDIRAVSPVGFGGKRRGHGHQFRN